MDKELTPLIFGASPKKSPKGVKRTRQKWDDSLRLTLLLEIAKIKNLKLSEDEWKTVSNRIDRTWNAAREEYGSLMGDRFSDWKRGSKKAKPTPASSANPPDAASDGSQDDPTGMNKQSQIGHVGVKKSACDEPENLQAEHEKIHLEHKKDDDVEDLVENELNQVNQGELLLHARPIIAFIDTLTDTG
ncbi:uncharacterized protein BO97DRAFT_424985 [Aspergillus homomorphus CBS 101889]|uniref:Myb/SANT-like domain-containing protein n=1 Tax=Aspergillus homomorphus (strain CBS 101889) TaxID=1450537 RepID=A0A395HYW6_ASPHC|nr:hypothetical protein BO97DRAFT_424985 [Aspergillus homomorphus CBS 101889]RAL12058.1 hypothetical protein BO97DRAFT_424985 [Aspergillus homomorphus CBS 101889]